MVRWVGQKMAKKIGYHRWPLKWSSFLAKIGLNELHKDSLTIIKNLKSLETKKNDEFFHTLQEEMGK